ncbi:MAG: aldo/keto reductase [Caldisericum exile]|uniref:aldo/keto reductase n=1 Tax=Caldisericum exile TaxID=693075 RepID=UPI003C70F481
MPSIKGNLDRFALGTVQFGTDYGISNKDGITPSSEVAEILEYAWENDITMLDTAASYGISEEVIGRNIKKLPFKIVTKTPVFKKDKIEKKDADNLLHIFYNSLKKMNQSSLWGLLIHHASDLLTPGGDYLWQAMQILKQAGLVQKIGVSIYSPCDIESILDKYDPDIIQLPLNVLDQRLIKNGYLKLLKRKNIEIHARSVFLQGLLLMSLNEIPSYFNSIKPLLQKYQKDIANHKMTLLSSALAFVFNQPEIDYIIVGVNNKAHLIEIVDTCKTIYNSCKIDYSAYAIHEENIINPSFWRIK